jgi:hypothetical protein
MGEFSQTRCNDADQKLEEHTSRFHETMDPAVAGDNEQLESFVTEVLNAGANADTIRNLIQMQSGGVLDFVINYKDAPGFVFFKAIRSGPMSGADAWIDLDEKFHILPKARDMREVIKQKILLLASAK